MNKFFFVIFLLLLKLLSYAEDRTMKIIQLPSPKNDSQVSVEKALLKRRSVRSYSKKAITLTDIGQLLWAGQGITEDNFLRTAPSAGALYPIELYLCVYNVEGLEVGIYKYLPHKHSLQLVKNKDVRNSLARAALGQEWVRDGNAAIVIAAVFERTTRKYGNRGINYVYFEAGCVAENIHLQAETLKIGTVVVGAFYDDEVKNLLLMEKNETPIAIMPVGYKK